MTTALVRASLEETVGELSARLADKDACPEELDAVAVVDDEGRLVWDLPLLAADRQPARHASRPIWWASPSR